MRPDVLAILESAHTAGWVIEPRARQVLATYGLPLTRSSWVHSTDQALAAAAQIGYPVAAKVVSPAVVHKSDMGGVTVGIGTAGELEAAYTRMSSLPGFEGILVDEMARGVELIVGAKQDPQFGAVVLVGLGGTAVEVYQDVAIRMAPLTRQEAEASLTSLKARVLLEGYRGSPPVHREHLIELLVRFSEMAHELGPRIESIDCNPVFCSPERVVIADARILLPQARKGPESSAVWGTPNGAEVGRRRIPGTP